MDVRGDQKATNGWWRWAVQVWGMSHDISRKISVDRFSAFLGFTQQCTTQKSEKEAQRETRLIITATCSIKAWKKHKVRYMKRRDWCLLQKAWKRSTESDIANWNNNMLHKKVEWKVAKTLQQHVTQKPEKDAQTERGDRVWQKFAKKKKLKNNHRMKTCQNIITVPHTKTWTRSTDWKLAKAWQQCATENAGKEVQTEWSDKAWQKLATKEA